MNVLKLFRRKPKRQAWTTIGRYGQRTDRPMVTLTLHGVHPGGSGSMTLFALEDIPSNNALIEMHAKSIRDIAGLPFVDDRKTPWNYPRDGIAPTGTLPVWFERGDLIHGHVKYVQVNSWNDGEEERLMGRHPDIPRPATPVFAIPGYAVVETLGGEYIAHKQPYWEDSGMMRSEYPDNGRFDGGVD